MKRIALLTICAAVALVNARAQTGDAAVGERLFAGKGNCATCHIVRGRGGVLGPDLSDIGRDRTAAQIEQALRDPSGAGSYPAVTVRLHTAQTIHGIARNENAFELQFLDLDGNLHLLSKEQGADIVRDRSLMPKLAWTSNEMRDLVSYLSRLTIDPNAKARLAITADVGPGIPFDEVAYPKSGSWPT